VVTTPTTTTPAAAAPATTGLPPPVASTPAVLSKSNKTWMKWGSIACGCLVAIATLTWAANVGQGRTATEGSSEEAESTATLTSLPDDPIKCSDVDPVNVTAPPMKNGSSPEDLANFGEYVRGVGYCTQASVPGVQNLRVLCTLLDGSTTTDLNRCQEGVLGIRYGSKSPHEIPVTISYMRTPG